MTSYPEISSSRGQRSVPWLRLAALLIAVPILLETAAGIAGNISFEPDSRAQWDAFLAAPLITAGLAASAVWWIAVYWLRRRSSRPLYAAIALAIIGGCLLAGQLDRGHRANQRPQLTAALNGPRLGPGFAAGPVTYRPDDGPRLPTATRAGR